MMGVNMEKKLDNGAELKIKYAYRVICLTRYLYKNSCYNAQ